METFDPNSQESWNKRLIEEGLPEILDIDKNPIDMSSVLSEEKNETELLAFGEAFRGLLGEYSSLPKTFQDDILEDVYKKHAEGWLFADVISRVKMLIKKEKELLKMSGEDSDKVYNPKPSIELNGETKKLIEELEKIRKQQEQEEEKEEEKPIPQPPKKEWIN